MAAAKPSRTSRNRAPSRPIPSAPKSTLTPKQAQARKQELQAAAIERARKRAYNQALKAEAIRLGAMQGKAQARADAQAAQKKKAPSSRRRQGK